MLTELSDPRATMAPVPRLGSEAPLVGRAEELTRLTAAVERARTGRPAAVLLSGDAGVGKTRLLDRALRPGPRRRRDRPHRTLRRPRRGRPALPARSPRRCASWPSRADAGDETLAEALRARPGARPADHPARPAHPAGRRRRRRRRPAAALRRGRRRARRRRRGRRAGAAGHRGPALGRPVHPRPALLPAGPAAVRAAGRGRLLPGRRPAPAPPAAPAARRAGPAADRRAARAVPVHPGELRDYLRALQRRAGARAAGPGRAGPLRGQRLLRRGALRRRPGLRRGEARRCRPALADVLLARLERLPAAVQRIARVASVAGRRVSHPLLQAASGLSDAEVEEALREAVTHHVLVAEGGDRYAFRHALLQEAVYGDLLPGERVRLHGTYARLLGRRRRGRRRRPSWPTTACRATTWPARCPRRSGPPPRRPSCTRRPRRCATWSRRSSCGTRCRTRRSGPAAT